MDHGSSPVERHVSVILGHATNFAHCSLLAATAFPFSVPQSYLSLHDRNQTRWPNPLDPEASASGTQDTGAVSDM